MATNSTRRPDAKRTAGSLHRDCSTAPSDLRSPLAKARDEWLASEEGEKLTHPGILRDRSLRHYLENRIALAFLAGVAAAQKLKL